MDQSVCHHFCHASLQPIYHPSRLVQVPALLLDAELTVVKGVFIVNETFEITITQNGVFKPQCTGGSSGIVHGGGFGDNSTVTDLRTPFYASTTPQIFAIAVATVVSYFLVILIFITPRTFFVGGTGGGAGFLTRRGLSGNSSVIGVGRRPLLQKIAAVTVAISMTIATADTFKVAKRQYEEGFMDSEEMVKQVTEGLEIRVVQVVSDTFLWLAQVQTLIRLFPRHKEKVTIKWLGFALILLDVIFSSLNNFLVLGTNTRPLKSRDAIPALSYLFELAIGFIYASCIIYYALSKYRFAFYHAKMRNICLVALLSITSVLIPVVFFVIDVSSPDIATWGFYIRWVGAAAASVVVWEWVERIEALERDERKDGILGREIYDGDEMLDATTANGVDWPRRRRRRLDDNGSDDSGNVLGLKDRFRARNRPLRSRMLFNNSKNKTGAASGVVGEIATTAAAAQKNVSGPAPPVAAATPVSRADTTSAASTVYAVRYHNLQGSSPHIPEVGPCEPNAPKVAFDESTPENTVAEKGKGDIASERGRVHVESRIKPISRPPWAAVSNPFKRRRAHPPAEIVGAQMLEDNCHRRSPARMVNSEKWKIRSRMDAFKTVQRDKLRSRQPGKVDEPLPVMIIPAQPRGTRTWSPDDLAEVNDATKNLPAQVDDGQSPDLAQLPESSSDPQDDSVFPAPIPEGRIWPPEDIHTHQESGPYSEESQSALQQHKGPPDRELRSPNEHSHDTSPRVNDQLDDEAQQPHHHNIPSETTRSSSHQMDELGRPDQSNAEHIPRPLSRISNHEPRVSNGVPAQTNISSGPNVAAMSPPSQHVQLPSPLPPTGEAGEQVVKGHPSGPTDDTNQPAAAP
jgi:PalH/RIM21